MRRAASLRRSPRWLAILIGLALALSSLCEAHGQAEERAGAGHHQDDPAPVGHEHDGLHAVSCDGEVISSTMAPVPSTDPAVSAAAPAPGSSTIVGPAVPRSLDGHPPPGPPLFILHATLLI